MPDPSPRICVYCGSSRGSSPVYAEAARALGRSLVERGCDLVFGGGRVGLMGVVADTVLEAGGQALGVIPRGLVTREVAHPGLSELRVVASMHERKALMAELADAFVALPGGYGTLEELAETLTWTGLGIHRKPCGLLDVDGFYSGLLAFFERARADGFLGLAPGELFVVERDPARLIERLLAFEPPRVRRWLERDET